MVKQIHKVRLATLFLDLAASLWTGAQRQSGKTPKDAGESQIVWTADYSAWARELQTYSR